MILIDVRTPSEFSTGALSANNSPAINIEYQLISQLPHVLSAHGIDVQTSDPITLYCRSGRRSNIALQELRELGYSNVRDIGGFEDAREVLRREEESRVEKGVGAVEQEVVEKDGVNEVRIEGRKKAFGDLLAGLKGLEEE